MEGALSAGTVFAGDFRIVRPLSTGGMGVLYVAEQLSTSRERALKVMLPGLAGSEDLRRRFAQEARVGAQIESEHVVEVVGAGIDAATGAPWLAMELLQGEDFATYLARTGPLAPRAVLEIFEQFTHALGSAHEKNIVHRDLKPENLFLARSRRAQSQFMVKVLDFGIAKLVDKARSSATGAMGTPLWMAPEQMTPGSSIAPATDVWALGLIAFRALSGKCYWKSAGEENASSMTVIREVAMDPVVPASARAYELGCATLPVGFDAWFARCVDRDPHARFANATAAQEALRPVLSGAANATTPAAPLPIESRGQRVSRTTPDPSNISVPPVTSPLGAGPTPNPWPQQHASQAQGAWPQPPPPQQHWQQPPQPLQGHWSTPQQASAPRPGQTVIGESMFGQGPAVSGAVAASPPFVPGRLSGPPPVPISAGRKKKSNLGLYLGIGGALAALAVVLVIVVQTQSSAKKPHDDDEDDDRPSRAHSGSTSKPAPPPQTPSKVPPPPPSHTTPPPPPPPPAEPAPVVAVEISPKEPSLKNALIREIHAAKADGSKVIVWTTRPGCDPCTGLMRSLPDPRMRQALDHVRLVSVNVSAMIGPLTALGYDTRVLPCFFLVNDEAQPIDGISGGEWGKDIAENMGPVLGPFARGTYRSRKSPIKRYSNTP